MSELRQLFLEGFVIELIKNAHIIVPKIIVPEHIEKSIQIPSNPASILSQRVEIVPTTKEINQERMYKSIMPKPIQRVKTIPRYIPQPRRILNRPNIRSMPIQQMPRMNFKPGAPQLGVNLIGLGLGKFDFLLSDPGVISIECPGPDKPILVNKNGIVQISNIRLKKEDIDNIIKEISEKTRIPLLQGVFKAAFGQFILTAIISEFVGTRFLIQKKRQVEPPSPFRVR